MRSLVFGLALTWLTVTAGAHLAGCSSDDQVSTSTTGASSTSSTGAGGSGGGSMLPPPICKQSATPWKPGVKAFKEATDAWGLTKIGAQGVRLSAVDFDGDGWPDLVVRLGNNGSDDFGAKKRTTWLLRNTHDGHFEDVTEKSNLRANRTAKDPKIGRPGDVFAFADVDNDGDLDVYTGHSVDPMNPTPETSEVMLNNGDGTFSLAPAGSAYQKLKSDSPGGASFVDVDRDGFVDLWIAENAYQGTPQQSRLYKGNGKGVFADATAALGLTTKAWVNIDDLDKGLGHVIGWAANACDLNNDGNPDLLASSYGRAPNLFFQSLGKGGGYKFENRGVASGYAFDENQDWHDNESARCWCHLHPTDMGCMGVPPPDVFFQCLTDADAFRWDNTTDQHPFRLGGNSGTTTCADIDGDGNLDLLTSEIVHWDVGKSSDAAELLLNDGKADVTFNRPGNDATGLARTYKEADWNEGIMTNAAFDFDNDGHPDVYFGNSDYPGDHGLLYHQTTPGHFEAVSLADGIDHHRSHGIAIADFDRDGDLDIVVGHSFARCHIDKNDDSECYATQQVRFFENVVGNRGGFVQLTLTGGQGTNRAAIGARVTVKAGGTTQTQEVNGGHGHFGMQDDLTLHFGLGDACEADVTIRWPDQALTTQTFKLPAGYRFTITQGEDPKAVMP